MFNLSGGEIIIILVLALIVIGPEKLPDAVRKAGRAYAELRKLSTGFQSELQDNLGEPLRAVQDTVNMMRSDFQSVVNSVAGALDPTPSAAASPTEVKPGETTAPVEPVAIDPAPAPAPAPVTPAAAEAPITHPVETAPLEADEPS